MLFIYFNGNSFNLLFLLSLYLSLRAGKGERYKALNATMDKIGCVHFLKKNIFALFDIYSENYTPFLSELPLV